MDSISINLELDEITISMLEKSARLSYRSLTKEAQLRIIDHIDKFSARCHERVGDSYSQFKIQIPVTSKEKIQPLLKRGGFKTKSLAMECSSRLKEHLMMYAFISSVGYVHLH